MNRGLFTKANDERMVKDSNQGQRNLTQYASFLTTMPMYVLTIWVCLPICHICRLTLVESVKHVDLSAPIYYHCYRQVNQLLKLVIPTEDSGGSSR